MVTAVKNRTRTPEQAIVGFTTAFGRASNKLYERALHAEIVTSLYEPFDTNQIPQGDYDSLDRLRQYQRGQLSATGGFGGNGGGSIATSGMTPEYITLPHTDAQRSYNLDSLGNWRNTAFTPSTTGTPTPQTEIRQHNGLNEITRIANPAATDPLIIPAYDGVPGKSNGNLTFDGTLNYQWDALNRMAQALSGETAVGQYFYDAFNRRIRKIGGSVYTDFIYSGWRCLEDRNPKGGDDETTDTPIAQYIWGTYLDEIIQITTLANVVTGSGETEVTFTPGTYYPLQDLLYRTAATVKVSSEAVTIVEAYDTDAYGKTLIFNAVGSGSNWWADDAQQVPSSLCQFIFTGQRYDAETGLYYYKRRYYSPLLGRFVTRDPMPARQGEVNMYRYVDQRPTVALDPRGLETLLQLAPPDKAYERMRKVLEYDRPGEYAVESYHGAIFLATIFRWSTGFFKIIAVDCHMPKASLDVKTGYSKKFTLEKNRDVKLSDDLTIGTGEILEKLVKLENKFGVELGYGIKASEENEETGETSVTWEFKPGENCKICYYFFQGLVDLVITQGDPSASYIAADGNKPYRNLQTIRTLRADAIDVREVSVPCGAECPTTIDHNGQGAGSASDESATAK